MTSTTIAPIGTNNSSHGYEALRSNTYTAHRLKHASAEHLHLTTRRFFIGPIPEGWLNSNRKAWYNRRVELSSYSSRTASFRVSADTGRHHRTDEGLDGPSMAARMNFSFPQPDDVNDSAAESTDAEEEEEDNTADAVVTQAIEPIATHEVDRPPGIADGVEPGQSKDLSVPRVYDVRDTLRPPPERGRLLQANQSLHSNSPRRDSYMTATSRLHTEASAAGADTGEAAAQGTEQGTPESTGATDPWTPSTDHRASYGNGRSDAGSPFPGEASSRTRLLPKTSETTKRAPRSMTDQAPAPLLEDMPDNHPGRTGTGVRFDVMAEGLANQQERIVRRVDSARARATKKLHRQTSLVDGQIIKMERMLVRVDFTMQQLSDEYEENESMKTESRIIEKWREFMVVARKNKVGDGADFRLQIYKTRVIPELDDEKARKKPVAEVRLDHATLHVNLYSTLDKSVVLWHPYDHGTRIVIMRPRSNAHAVEWYTFLRDSLGWKRPEKLQVLVPDLDVSLMVQKPFEDLKVAHADAADENTAIAKAVKAEQAVAGKVIKECIQMLERNAEWSSVLEQWSDTAKMGLAWKRYDRLEWVHGINEQKMYGSMAMQQSHDLELRPKQHYPTTTSGRKGTFHEEPAPVEGFLVRLTSQKGIHQRFGKTFFKRLYFSTNNQFLIYNRPAKVTPPHPPRLATISGRNIPSSHEIVEATPMMFDVDPFPLSEDKSEISWLQSPGNTEHVSRHDREAFEEASRALANLSSCDGYMNMCRILRVRHMKWGATPADEEMESGSDVDFHQEVEESQRDDGTTKQIDAVRTFELVLDNGLIVRLQAYDQKARDEWIKRLRQLVKYWKRRTAADMDLFKAIRNSNLTALNIDEEMEAAIGQFARKWEVQRSEASPQLYHMCGISCCRSITTSGLLYLKALRRATFHRCGVILAGGQLLIFQSSLRRRTGEQIRHIHQERTDAINLKECYVYSGLITEDDLLYRNRTFDSNHPALQALPRIYLEDAWTSTDEDSMTCFVVWRPVRRGWFRAVEKTGITGDTRVDSATEKGGATKSRLRRVAQLGVPGRTMVFKCRSRAERDQWVLNVANEIERVVEAEAADGADVRFAGD